MIRPNSEVVAEILRARAKANKPKKQKRIRRKRGGARAAIWKANDNFYCSDLWRSVRYQAFKRDGGRCCCCGSTAKDGVRMHVDHIKPRSRFPELQLELSNLQVLCEPCNRGKSNRDTTDWHSQ